MSKHIVRINIIKAQTVNFLQHIAFCSGETQYDTLQKDKNLQVVASTTTNKVIWNNIILPERYEQQEMFRELPDYLKYNSQKKLMISNARNVLWKNILVQEARPDAQLARVFSLSIPHFLTVDEASTLITKFSKILVKEGMIVDASIHDHNKGEQKLSMLDKLNILQGKQTEKQITKEKEPIQDYTAYLMCTLRDYKNGYFHNKNRDWNATIKLIHWRKEWIFNLYDAILNSKNGTTDEILNWNKKMKIYPEYEEAKNHFNSIALQAQSTENSNFELSFNSNDTNEENTSKKRLRM